jgi:Tfp pilus assembly protein PilO
MTGTDLTALVKKQPVGFACLIVALLCGVLIYWRGGKIDESKALYEAKAKERDHVLANVRNASGLPQQTEAMQQAAQQLDSRLVIASRLATNLQFFYRLESETGVKLLDVRQGALSAARPATKGLYAGVPYTVSIQGTFKQALDFMQRVENGPHFVRFATASVNKATTDAAGGDALTISLKLELLGKP